LKQAERKRETMAADYSMQATLESMGLSVGTDAWILRGRILDADERPVTGVRINLVDKDGLAVSGVSAVTTDDHGNFVILGQREAMPELGATPPQWHVNVEDKKGNILQRTTLAVRVAIGASEKVNIVVAKDASLQKS
jgi:hypothetical protein